jgi:hypothetical protein
MKIIPTAYVHGCDKDGKRIAYPSGVEVDLPKPVAEDLLARGFARVPGELVPVEQSSGPNILPVDEAGASVTTVG